MDVLLVGCLIVSYMSSAFCKFDRIEVLFVGIFYAYGPLLLKCIGMYLNGDFGKQRDPR